MAYTKLLSDPGNHLQSARDLSFLRRLKELTPLRMVRTIQYMGMVAPGFNLTWQTDLAKVLELIRKLRPLDCGRELIRIGGTGDGGYLIPNDLDGIEYCFSPGVSTTSSFEDELADRGIKSFLADYSVDAPPISRPEFIFDKKFLGAVNDEQFFTLASWKNKYLKDYAGDLILQMDIEDGEYQVILSAPAELLNQFRILVIEFHSLQRLFDPFDFRLITSCFEKLLESFYVVHIHPNNYYCNFKIRNIEVPSILEFTFLNKKRAINATPVQRLPNPLDVPNVPYRSNPNLPEYWYGGS